jgi:cytidine deaminase
MQFKSIKIDYSQYDSIKELEEIDQVLVKKAKEALENAYAVYSQFYVGAALLLDSGEIITGNNQENIAYPSALCAERVALYYCKAQKPDAVVLKMAIMARSGKGKLTEIISPCGACRQVMSEYERIQKQPIGIIIQGENDTILHFKQVEDLLPFSFSTNVLGTKN